MTQVTQQYLGHKVVAEAALGKQLDTQQRVDTPAKEADTPAKEVDTGRMDKRLDCNQAVP